MKKSLASLSALALLAPVAACGADTSEADHTLTVANVWDAEHPMSAAVEDVFKTRVEEETGGAVEVEIHHGGTLGNEVDLWDSVRNGSVDSVVIGSAMNQEFPLMLISDWPFLYEDLEHARDVWTGEVAEDISAEFEDEFPSTEVLGWGPNSSRIFSSSEPLESVEDFAGQRIRMPSNPIHVGLAEHLGASPQIIPLGDLFTSLETGVVEGQDNGMVTLRSQALYEVQDYVYETDHITATLAFIVNSDYLDTLPEEHRAVVEDAAAEASSQAWDDYIDSIDEDRELLEENGVTVTQPTEEEREEMISAIQPLYDELYAEHPWAEELVAEIEAVN